MQHTTRRRALNRLTWLASATLLAGCASPPGSTATPGTGWLTGRLSLRVEGAPDQPPRQFSSAFELQGDAQQGELRLLSPLGNVAAAARWGLAGVVLRTSEGERAFADLTALSHAALGENLPLQALPSWLNGRAWPGAEANHTADGFDQLGWRVQTSELADGRLNIGRAQAPAVHLRVRLDRPG